MKYHQNLMLHCIKTYGKMIVIGAYTPFLAVMIWSEIKNILG